MNPESPRVCVLQQEKPLQWETQVPQVESTSLLPQGKPAHHNENLAKSNKIQ